MPKETEELKEYIFAKQKELYKRNKLKPNRKRMGTTRKETNKMLYKEMVIID